MFDESLEDEGILFYAVIKWLVLSVIAGLLVGGSVGLFLIILYKSIDWVAALPDQRYILIPVAPSERTRSAGKAEARLHQGWHRHRC